MRGREILLFVSSKRGVPRLCAGLAVCAPVFFISAVSAEPLKPDHVREVGDYYRQHVESWINGPEIVAAIRNQNSHTAGMDEAAILIADEQWRAEVGSDDTNRPMVEEVMSRDISAYLKKQQRAADWMIVEIIVMDAKGLNVGLSTPTSDYWQGDEAKHVKTFQAASRELFIDDVEFEAEAGLLLSQVSQTVFDPETGEPIGAVTVSVNMNKL